MINKVSIVKYKKSLASVEKAVTLSNALGNLASGDKVFIKPNIVFWSRKSPMPPWGVITTTRVVEDVVKLLKNRGISRIVIGEGTITSNPKDRETAAHAFETLGYNKIADKYGVEVLNLFEKRFRRTDLGDGIFLNIAENLLDADYVVSLPVLKTHAQTVVSLGQKNLKGCLDMESRKLCHSDNMEKDLDFHVARLIKMLPRSCTIIDGIYTMERGPAYTGKARRSDILIASGDMLFADIAGTCVLGIDPASVPHIRMVCEERDVLPSVDSVNIVGESIESVKSYHQWDFPFNKESNLPYNLETKGICGLSFPKYDHSICTYCSELIGPLQVAIGNAWKGEPFDDVEILTGKIQRPAPGMKHTILLGKCQVKLNKNNPDINNPIPVPGCPPKVKQLIKGLKQAGIKVDPSYFDNIEDVPGLFMKRYAGKPEFTQEFYRII